MNVHTNAIVVIISCNIMGTCASADDDDLLALMIGSSFVLGRVKDGSTILLELIHT